jgi:hypothetical protein
MSNAESCLRCRFFKKEEGAKNYFDGHWSGQCRRHPKPLFKTSNEWCGEYKERERGEGK